MTSQRASYKTTSLDLTSYLAAIGYAVNVTGTPGEYRATFEITQTPRLFSDIAEYESNGTAPAKKLLNIRSRLFREASEIHKRGRS